MSVAYSPEMIEQAQREAAELRERATTARAEAHTLITQAAERLETSAALEQKALDLDEMCGAAPQLSLVYEDEILRGQRLREEAIRVLVDSDQVGAAIHYKRWLQLLTDAGLRVFGKNPAASFLTEISRIPLVQRVENEAGTYRLDARTARRRASQRVSDAHRQLRRIEQELGAANGDSVLRAELEDNLVAARREVDAAEREATRVAQAEASLLGRTAARGV